jgi:hypothetical protein
VYRSVQTRPPQYLIKQHNLLEKVTKYAMCVFSFSLQISSKIFPNLTKTELDIINKHRSSCKVHVILVRF